jgi:serine/threonine protein kinase
MTELNIHPTNQELHAYSIGQLPEDRAVAIDDHISSCERCCETIVSLPSDDTFVGLLQDARQSPTDQTVDLPGAQAAATSSSGDDVPQELVGHPRYEILGLIGKGGMGDVYKARHRMMKRTVALKVIKQELVRNHEAVDRFHREVTTAAQLTHANIVTSHDAEQAGDVHYLVMEYVDGVDLANMVKQRGALPIAEACAYIRQAAIGLQHAHEQGMVHRDIKPHNLMVADDGTVKILDFGLASLAPEALSDGQTVESSSDLTAAGAIMGTPDFISPEQAEDARSADIRSDIYSLGSTLYYLLSGYPPFHDGSVLSKLKNLATEEPTALESLRDDLPDDLTALVARMTAKRPDDRFQSPQEVAEVLNTFVVEASRGAAPQPTRRSGGLSFKRIGGAVLATMIGAAGLLVLQRDTPEKDRDRLDSFLTTGQSKEPAGDILRRLLRTERGRSYLRKLDAKHPKLAYTSGKFSPGYTSVAAMAYVNRITGVAEPEMLVMGSSLTTAGMHKLGLPEALIIKSVEFDNAPDDTCRAILNIITLEDVEFMELKTGSLYESRIGIKDLLGQNSEDTASLFDAFVAGRFIRKATAEEAARSRWAFQSALRRPSAEHIPAISPLTGLTLSAVSDEKLTWVFEHQTVTITNAGEAIPGEITSEIAKDGDEHHTIEASWTLGDRNRILQLRNLRVGGVPLAHEVELPFSSTGNVSVSVGQRQYNTFRTRTGDVQELTPATTPSESDTATDSVSPTLEIANHSRGPNSDGEFRYGWNLMGRSIGAFDLRLMVVRNGKAEIAQRFDCLGPAESCAGEILLNVEKQADGAGHLINARVQDRTFGLPDRISRVRHILPLKIDLPDDDRGITTANGRLDPEEVNILYSTCYSDGDTEYDRTFDGMLEASRDGAVFVLLTVDWKPIAMPATD